MLGLGLGYGFAMEEGVVLTAVDEALRIGNGRLHLRRYARFGSGWACKQRFWAIAPKSDGSVLCSPKMSAQPKKKNDCERERVAWPCHDSPGTH
jgi:hypothetical protein